jgi:S1-C subfamily serine protease
MNSPTRALLLTCLGCIALGCSAERRISTFEHPDLAVVRIYAFSPLQGRPSECRGFAISSDGIIATSLHAIEGWPHITITPPNGPSLTATVLEIDRESDLALLKAPGEGMDFLHLESDEIDPGIHVRVAHRQGVTHGVFDHWEDFGKKIAFTAPITEVDVGAPLLADDGKAIGVVLGPSGGHAGESLAAPIYHVVRMLPKLTAQ